MEIMKGFRLPSDSFRYCIIIVLLMGIVTNAENSVPMSADADVHSTGSRLTGPGGVGRGPASQPSAVNDAPTLPLTLATDKEQQMEMIHRYSKALLDNWMRFRQETKTGSVEFQPSATKTVEDGVEGIRSDESMVGMEELSPYPQASILRHIRKRSADSTGASKGVQRETDKQDLKKSHASVSVSRSGSRFPAPFCELELDSGIICPGVREGLQVEQFYYDADNNRCSHFFYNGCGGNANRFFSLWECTQSCVIA